MSSKETRKKALKVVVSRQTFTFCFFYDPVVSKTILLLFRDSQTSLLSNRISLIKGKTSALCVVNSIASQERLNINVVT